MRNIRGNNEGFTIVEMIITLAIFSGLMITISLMLVQVLNFQRRSLGAQKVQENALFMFELMAREIRVSRVENQDSNCTATTLTITHPVNGAVSYTYIVASRKVTRTQGGATADLTGADVAVNRFNFCVSGSNPADNLQAHVSMLAQIQPVGLSTANTTLFNLQTGVTSRDIVTEYQN